jgi:hypothetical protein
MGSLELRHASNNFEYNPVISVTIDNLFINSGYIKP